MRFLPVLTTMAAGACVAVQGPVNARLRLAVGSPIFSAAVSFFSGTLVCLCLLASGAFGGAGSGFRGLLSAPPWAFLGGTLGLSMVLGAIFSIPQTGAVVVICSAVVGQMLGSYAIDALGLFGVEKVPFSWARLGGLGLSALGVLLVQRK